MKYLYLIYVLLMLPVVVSAQTGKIEGQALAGGAPAAFASIGLVGSSVGATADEEGYFELTPVLAGEHKISVSAIGFRTQEVAVTVKAGETSNVKVTLQPQDARLREVVVSGTMRETYLLESPVPVEIYTPKYFQKNPTPAIFEALEIVNGVQPQINCSVCGTGDIHINGMEGAYTMVLIDGMPIVSALSTVYGLSGIPNSLIERVEVVKGPASTLYGSEAVAGLLNIITKSPATAPRLSADLFYTSHRELNADIGYSKRWNRASTMLSTNYFRFADRRDVNQDNFTDIPLQHRFSIFNKWSLNRLENRVANLAARYYYEDRFGGEMQWQPVHRGGDHVYGESVYTSRYEVLGSYQLPIPENLLFSFSYNDHQQNAAYGETNYKGHQRVGFGQLVWDRDLGAKQKLLLGTTYRYTWYDDNTPATQEGDDEATENSPDQTSLPGAFAQHEYKASDKFTLLSGLRYDHHSAHGGIFSPRLSIRWAPDEDNIFRLSMGNGYRVVNLFTEDHAALTGAREVVIRNELKPEQSYNVNLNYQRYIPLGSGFLNLEGSAFYTYFTNKIVADFLTNNTQIIYDNLSGHAISKGIALNTELAFTFPLRLHTGVTLMDVYQVQDTGEGQHERVPQLHAPRFSGTFTASYQFRQLGLTLDYTGSVKGPMYLPVQENDFRPEMSPWFSLQNLQVTKTMGEGLELYGGVKNLLNFMPKHPLMRPFDPFDRQVEVNNPYGYSFDTEYNYAPMQGRRFFLGVRYTLPQ
ncbi:TonB-dependent receptor [Pontibacter lucknowensis]|uniref:Outer membrane receptor for ferrienterochelin and colicins n=1 Tax=Pontibacter lucknowensis TaxID=1077936 RepID=A0A1N6YJ65_9BACT|nr:TonB-dependent receptor [Pontibacter lucknowensis]SIR14644.1 outer membrane receptor for ferrienterochelin and colicins [Pontibacter lucknowensis]